ncbi:MAG TPA: AgmX/PglI C-terminal domain-containing protein [Vulgatibacter sp.]|nr:AgmX/PglI C-terminal domain-containing protein [Vulgatibacter sp.]
MIRRVLPLVVLLLPIGAFASGPARDVPEPAAPTKEPGGTLPPAPDETLPPRPRDLPFTRENVLQVVRAHGEQIQACYEDAMARRGANAETAPAGRVVMSWTITLQGLAADVKVKRSEISDPLVTECIAQAIRFWEFPRPPDPQPVEFPFDLKPVGGKKPGPKGK